MSFTYSDQSLGTIMKSRQYLAAVLYQSPSMVHGPMIYSSVTSELQAASKGVESRKCLKGEHFWKTIRQYEKLKLLDKSVLKFHMLQT